MTEPPSPSPGDELRSILFEEEYEPWRLVQRLMALATVLPDALVGAAIHLALDLPDEELRREILRAIGRNVSTEVRAELERSPTLASADQGDRRALFRPDESGAPTPPPPGSREERVATLAKETSPDIRQEVIAEFLDRFARTIHMEAEAGCVI